MLLHYESQNNCGAEPFENKEQHLAKVNAGICAAVSMLKNLKLIIGQWIKIYEVSH